MNSPRPVTTNQNGLHAQLSRVVRRHLATPFRKPIAEHNRAAFEQANKWLLQQARPLILDSFCGNGESTRHLAQHFADHAVIGVDRSPHRLARHPADSPGGETANYLLVRTDTDDFWRLALTAGWQPVRHYLLYPNPWPKSAHLQRRCHGSPLFPTLLQMGGRLEVRSNWSLYIEEFCESLALAGAGTAQPETYTPETPITAFERKYHEAGQTLWRCVADLAGGDG